ncbi:MAG TPA: hypothetical protein DCM62_02935, partial [Bacteroidales bacterium]|nr:hypothetical protein [Bacteroidales bacterium]
TRKKEIADKTENKHKLTNYQVVWLAAYNFKRATAGKTSDEVKNFLTDWVNQIFTGKVSDAKLTNTKYHALQYLAIAARWAAMENR